MGLRPAEDTLTYAVEEALEALTLTDEDAAAIGLVTLYAAAIDADPTVLSEMGPKLLAALESLGATPRARAGIMRKQGPGVSTELGNLRAQRRRQG